MNSEKRAPIVLFAYKRIDHLSRTIDALKKNKYAQESILYIFQDAAACDSEKKEVVQVSEYLLDIQKTNWFKDIVVDISKEHRGLASSVIAGVTQIIDQYGKIIVVEDDLVTSNDFLEYMNLALDFYEDNEKIWSISGYTPALWSLRKYPYEVYFSYRGCSWGWGTWKNRWEKVDWNVSDYEEFVRQPKQVARFNRGGPDMARLLEAQMMGRVDSWAVRWCYQQSKEDMLTVYPKRSRVLNIGLDGTGAHCRRGIIKPYPMVLKEGMDSINIKFTADRVDEKIINDFYRFYSDKISDRIYTMVTTFYRRKRC